jgi:hypothetical protein
MLFSIGTDVYKQANPELDKSDSNVSSQQLVSDEDNTITADYEAIE